MKNNKLLGNVTASVTNRAPGALSGGKELIALELEQRFRAGDEDALAELMALLSQPLLRYCHGILCDYHEAQDAVQTAFIKAYDHRGRIPIGALSPWLYRAAYTTCIDLLRRRRLRRTVSPPSPAPSEPYMRGELREALLSLSPPERAILFSRVAGATYEELEKVYHLSPAALRKRYQRAKDKLAHYLAETEAHL